MGSNLVAPTYMMIAAVVGTVAVLMIPKTARKPLDGSPPAVSTDEEARRMIRQLGRKKMPTADTLEV